MVLYRRHGAVDAAALGELRQGQALVEHGGTQGQLDVASLGLFGQADDGAPDDLTESSQWVRIRGSKR